MGNLDADQYTAYLALQGLADNSIRNYRAMYLRWCDWAVSNQHDPYRPDPLAVRAFANQLHGGRSLVAHARATIGHLCAALGLDDVSAAIPLPRQQTSRQYRGLEHADAVALCDQALSSGLKGGAVLVGLYTAARRSEIASLSWRRIDLEAGTVTLERPKTRDLHTVLLHPHLAAWLDARRVPGETWVFPGKYGGHLAPSTIWRWVLDIAEAAGIGRVTPHSLRHTAITEAYDATGDLRSVQDFAGHVDPSVTAKYTRVSEQRMRQAVGSLNFAA